MSEPAPSHSTSEHADGAPRYAGEPARPGEERRYVVDPKSIKMTFAGVEIVGFADGAFVEATDDVPQLSGHGCCGTPYAPRAGGCTLTLISEHGDRTADVLDALSEIALVSAHARSMPVTVTGHDGRVWKFDASMVDWADACRRDLKKARRRARMARKKRRGWA